MFIPTAPTKDGQQLSDQEVIRRYVKAKDEQWVNELYRRFIHLIFGVCLKYTANRETSKELSIVVFEKMLEQLPLQPAETFRNFNVWLFVLVKNTCISYLRKEQTARKRMDQLKNLADEEDGFMENDGFVRLLDSEAVEKQSEKLESLLLNALKELSPKQRKCIRKFFYEKLSYKEIQQETKMELSEIKSALQNGKRKLRLFLTNRLNQV